jgi:hypothetical protein
MTSIYEFIKTPTYLIREPFDVCCLPQGAPGAYRPLKRVNFMGLWRRNWLQLSHGKGPYPGR